MPGEVRYDPSADPVVLRMQRTPDEKLRRSIEKVVVEESDNGWKPTDPPKAECARILREHDKLRRATPVEAAGPGTLERFLEVQYSQVSYQEVPRNRTKYGRWYGMDGVAWCHIYQCWVCAQSGVPLIRTAYTPTGADWFKGRGLWRPQSSKTIAVGDLIYFYWPNMGRIAHIEALVAFHDSNTFITIGGNTNSGGSRTGGMVARQVRSRATVGRYGGFGRLTFKASEDVMNAKQEAKLDAAVKAAKDAVKLGHTAKNAAKKAVEIGQANAAALKRIESKL
jgi:hypothetical protein